MVKARRLKAAEDATDGGASRLGDAERFPHLVGTENAPHAGNSISDVPSVAGQTIDSMAEMGKRLEALLARDADLRTQLAELETSLPARLEDLVGQWQGKASRTVQGAIKRRDAKGPLEKVARRKEADRAIMEAAGIIARSQQDLPASELDLLASQIIDRILGTPMGRLPYDQPVPSETAYGKPRNSNGDLAAPLKERSFNIPDALIEPWLDSDIEVIAKACQRSLVPDLELVRAFGDLEMTDVQKAIERDFATLAERAPDEATRKKLKKQHDRAILDLEGMRDRIRGRYALPEDPHSFSVRAPQFMRNMNYLSKLGGMTISAATDLARPGMVHGMRVFSAGLIPLVRNIKGYRLAAEEVKRAGAGWEMVSNARALAMADMMDDGLVLRAEHDGRGTALERGVKGLADHFGLVSLMAPWNAALKQFSGIVTTSRLIDAATAARAGTITDKELTNLAASGISEDMGRRIADQFDRFGRVEEGGIRLPETGNWTDREAAEALRAAIVRDVDRIIVTPGQDKPLWMSHEVGKLVGQFRSFGFAAVQRILLSGLQQRDAAALSGAVLSVGLGMGVYALKTMQFESARGARHGGELSDDPTQWLVEGVDRSGLFGWLMDMNNTAEKVTRGRLGIAALTGESVSRYQSRNMIGAAAGPIIWPAH